MYFKFTPSLCDGKTFQGHVEMRNLSFDERMELYEELGIDEQPVDDSENKKLGMKLIRAIGKKSSSFVKSCEITRVSDGQKWTDWNEVYHEGMFTSLIIEVCTQIMGKMTAAS